MNITFLMGNGFDLGCGLKSRFTDFFPIYCDEAKGRGVEVEKFAEELKHNGDKWSDFEWQIGQYTDKFTPENKWEMIDQLRDFETQFMLYLEKQEEKLSFEDSEYISQRMIKALSSFYDDGNLHVASRDEVATYCRNATDHNFNFLSFNYTKTLERCLETIPDGIIRTKRINGRELIDKVCEVYHPHGIKSLSPIMGINDASQIKNKDLMNDERYLRYIVKPKINEMQRMNYDSISANIISQSTIICVYGMSLGYTDKIWWKRIISWLYGDANRQLVLFLFDDKFNEANQFDWIRKEDDVIDKLSEFVEDTGIKVESLRGRIHLAIHKNIFSMDLTKKEETTKDESEQAS